MSYIDELTRVLAPGGVLVFQVPARPLGAAPRTIRSFIRSHLPAPVVQAIRERLHPRRPVIPMHVIPRAIVEARLAANPALRVRVEPDDLAKGYESFMYFVARV